MTCWNRPGCPDDLHRRTADLGPGKPDPYLLNQAMGDVGAAPEDTVMIGDTTYDILTGRNAGAGAIGVTWGVHPDHKLRRRGRIMSWTRSTNCMITPRR